MPGAFTDWRRQAPTRSRSIAWPSFWHFVEQNPAAALVVDDSIRDDLVGLLAIDAWYDWGLRRASVVGATKRAARSIRPPRAIRR